MSEFHSGIERSNFSASEPTFARPPEAGETTAAADRSNRYYRPDPAHPERLLRVDADDQAPAQADLTATAMHGAFRAFILDPHYPCVGARSAVNNHAYRLGIYDPLGGPEATAALARDLAAFTRGLDEMDASFATFVGARFCWGWVSTRLVLVSTVSVTLVRSAAYELLWVTGRVRPAVPGTGAA